MASTFFAMASHLNAKPLPTLAPYLQLLGLFPAFSARGPEALVLKESVFSLTGDNFSVTILDGRTLLQVQGELWSPSRRKHALDPTAPPCSILARTTLRCMRAFVA
jgi:hypothetical protein